MTTIPQEPMPEVVPSSDPEPIDPGTPEVDPPTEPLPDPHGQR